jgi:hypothetical protein
MWIAKPHLRPEPRLAWPLAAATVVEAAALVRCAVNRLRYKGWRQPALVTP